MRKSGFKTIKPTSCIVEAKFAEIAGNAYRGHEIDQFV